MIWHISKTQKNIAAYRQEPQKNTAAHRLGSDASRASDSDGRLSVSATCGRAEPGQWMRGRLQIKAGRG